MSRQKEDGVLEAAGGPVAPSETRRPAASGLIHGDCLEVMAGLDAGSVDAVVTDPPYGLEFMGKSWDRLGDNGQTSHTGPAERDDSNPFSRTRVSFFGSANVKCRKCGHWAYSGTPCTCDQSDFPNRNRHQGVLMQDWHQRWATEAFRVAKPGAYLLAFGGTRTYHRLTCAIEDAGWIIRDCLVWAYASGFPKSRALLKPAWEPIVMARKPGPLRELAIDACRIGPPLTPEEVARSGRSTNGAVYGEMQPVDWKRNGRDGEPSADRRYGDNGIGLQPTPGPRGGDALGRWPANVLLTDALFDGDTPGVVGGGIAASGGNINGRPVTGYGGHWADSREFDGYGDSGTYSRFFLIPKADRAEREPIIAERTGQLTAARANHHPTVKPLDLMRHLVRLVTPTGGTVLDCFAGSGTTLLAAEMEGFIWIGIEREAEYIAIAEARLNGTQRGLGLDVEAPMIFHKKMPPHVGPGTPWPQWANQARAADTRDESA